jgi:RNA polymerase sigma factor (sigma-70 family)
MLPLEERNILILGYLPKVIILAKLFIKRHKLLLDFDDLVQEGILGVIECSNRMDPKKEEFWKYAQFRVWGRMLYLLYHLPIVDGKRHATYNIGINEAILNIPNNKRSEFKISELEEENKLRLFKKSLAFLSKRDRDVGELLIHGVTRHEIAKKLKVSFDTIRRSYRRLLAKAKEIE